MGDVGGESTRPGAKEVPSEEEEARVARAAVKAGADWINDVSGGEFDPDMLSAAAELMVPIVLMHTKGTPQTMKTLTSYGSVVDEVNDHLLIQRKAAADAGVASWNIILDPGI